jgi:hypothetical protein
MSMFKVKITSIEKNFEKKDPPCIAWGGGFHLATTVKPSKPFKTI